MEIYYYVCCKHCPDDCGALDRHRFRCNSCQPNPQDGLSNG